MTACKKTFLALGLLSLASAVPAPAASVNTCAAVSAVVSALRAQSTASSFCTSLLKISTSTITSTSTATVIIPASTTITTGTNTLTASHAVLLTTTTVPTTQVTTTTTATTITTSVSTSTETAISTNTVTLVDCTSPPSANAKRAATTTTTSKANALASFANAALSSACRCLSLPTSSTTQHVTRTATSTSASTIQTAATAVVTPTISSVITVQTTIASETTAINTVNVIGATVTTTTSTVTATSTPGYCTQNNHEGFINTNGGNPYLDGNSLTGAFPFVADYNLVNGVLQEDEDSNGNSVGAYAYVLNGVNGGAVNFAATVPAGAAVLRCIVGSNTGSMHPFNCYNAQGMQWLFYTFDSDGSQILQVGLSIPSGATGKSLQWFGQGG